MKFCISLFSTYVYVGSYFIVCQVSTLLTRMTQCDKALMDVLITVGTYFLCIVVNQSVLLNVNMYCCCLCMCYDVLVSFDDMMCITLLFKCIQCTGVTLIDFRKEAKSAAAFKTSLGLLSQVSIGVTYLTNLVYTP
jgi:hypothetical protein